MTPEAYERLAAREDQYWWNRARRGMVADLFCQHCIPRRSRWLDLGCGPGGNLAALGALAPSLAVGLDLAKAAVETAQIKAKGAKFVRADLNNRLPFHDDAFDLVTMFNVLYHLWVEDESHVLREVARVLRPGAIAILTEPAFPLLSRAMDTVTMGKRRYLLPQVERMCRHAGLNICRSSYFTSFGFPLIYAAKLWSRIGRRKNDPQASCAADLKPIPPFLNGILYAAARSEGRAIAAGLFVPLGTTLICVVRKPLQ